MKQLITYLKNKTEVTPKAEAYINSICKFKKLRKGEILIESGQHVEKVYFVLKGCIRSYCIDSKEKEHTLHFAINGYWIGDYIAIHTNRKARLNVECIKDSEVIEFNFDDLNTLLEKFPEFEPFQRNNLEQHLVKLNQRILNQLQMTGEERYKYFLENFADVEKHIPSYHVATYIGVTQETLSRIKKRISFKS